MLPRQSFTAETVALQRSFESHRPRRERLFVDRYADAFLRPSLRGLAVAAAVPGLHRGAVGLCDAIGGPGPRPSAVTRTKVIDDASAAAAEPSTSYVILGAGYDTRAHRLPALADHRVFEVDHPATQTAKQAVVARLGLDTEHVTYVPVDFERDDLAQRLTAAGFDPAAPAVFLWEGVSRYLTADAVDGTLDTIHRLARPGALLVLTYVDSRALDTPGPFPEAARWVAAVDKAGEPWTFGLLPDQAAGFFADRGFTLREDVSMLDASRRVRAAPHGRDLGSALYRLAILARSDA